MIRWLEDLSDDDRTLPAVLVPRRVSPVERRARLKELAAWALNVTPESVVIAHGAQAPPLMVRPADTGLFLSSASRADWAVVAAARAPIGVDVEVVDPAGEIPWNALHPTETAFLKPIPDEGRAHAFARLWSVKEAYVKALRRGSREADSFAVSFRDDETAAIDDPQVEAAFLETRTRWWPGGLDPDHPTAAAVSVVILDGLF